MLNNVGGYGKQVNNVYGVGKGSGVKHGGKNIEKGSGKPERNTDIAEFSSLIEQPQEEKSVQSEMRIGAASEKTSKLSKTAQEYLGKLKEKYGNVDFIIADYKTDAEADALLAAGKGEYNAVITPDLLERMAADEETAAKYEALIDQSIESIDTVKKELGDDADMVDKFGTSVDSDGNLTLRAKLMDGILTEDGSDTVKASTVEEMLTKLKETREINAEWIEKIRAKIMEETARADKAEDAEKAGEADEAEASEELTTIDTGDVDKTIENIRKQREDVLAMLMSAQNTDKQAELEMMLKQFDRELGEKDNDSYRKVHAHHFTTSV